MHNPIPTDAAWLFDEFDGPRFWSRVNFQGGHAYLTDPLSRIGDGGGSCWTWTGMKGDDGYGAFNVFGRRMLAHRLAYRDFGLPLTQDQHIDHLCRNHACVRPSHLEAVSGKTNVERGLRGRSANPTCKNGHEWTAENTQWVQPSRAKHPYRACRACRSAWAHKYYERRTA